MKKKTIRDWSIMCVLLLIAVLFKIRTKNENERLFSNPYINFSIGEVILYTPTNNVSSGSTTFKFEVNNKEYEVLHFVGTYVNSNTPHRLHKGEKFLVAYLPENPEKDCRLLTDYPIQDSLDFPTAVKRWKMERAKEEGRDK